MRDDQKAAAYRDHVFYQCDREVGQMRPHHERVADVVPGKSTDESTDNANHRRNE